MIQWNECKRGYGIEILCVCGIHTLGDMQALNERRTLSVVFCGNSVKVTWEASEQHKILPAPSVFPLIYHQITGFN